MIMKNIIQFTQIWLTFLYVKCSVVVDVGDQQGLYIRDYCPKIGTCEEGTHVLCTHFDPKREISHDCLNNKNVTMTKEYAEYILKTINGIRSRIARGVPLGTITLPRGYGIFKLE
uniref:Seminal fluid protein HACP061 n=1 Tax=Heliconius melpomene TaxID=34740 RepID=D9HQA3_HELME|nr:seminal fluid protein HACP061 [Heliconius melpomene]